MKPTWIVGWLALLLSAGPAAAQERGEEAAAAHDAAPAREAAGEEITIVDDFGPDTPEPGSVEAIREHTTDEDFLPRSVRYLPDSETVPSPMDVLDAREARLARAAEGGEAVKPAREEDADKDGADKESKDLVLSGFMKGKEEVDGKPAILDVPVGRGRVVLFGFEPLHRHLNHSDFRFAWNAILHWDDRPR